MRVRIKPAAEMKNKDFWYDEIPGEEFEVWRDERLPGVYFVGLNLLIPGEDVDIIENGKEE